MGDNFLKFKRRLGKIRLMRAAFVGLSAGFGSAGIWLLLTKLAVIEFESIIAVFIGLGLALLSFAAVFLIGRKSDSALAAELDSKFGLKARVQTMIAYKDQEGELIGLQREDADTLLGSVPLKSYKFNRLWIYITSLVVCVAILVCGVIIGDVRDYVPPEEIEVFELSDMQRAGLGELIRYVESSDMEEEFRTPIADELSRLLQALEDVHTVPDMRAELALSMAVISDITYESSTAAEMLNALWDSDDIYFRYLAVALDTSSWPSPDWGDFAEKLTDYSAVLMGDNNKDEGAIVGAASLKWALDSMVRKLDFVLDSSGLDENDEIYAAIYRLFRSNPGGFSTILSSIDYYDDASAREALNQSLTFNSQSLYDAISLNRVNAATGEYAMTRLSSLFLVPLAEFERPEFVKTGEQPDGSYNSGSDKENAGGIIDGGIGNGAAYGSDDIVLDPLTGEPISYVELIDRYNAIMNERLSTGSYTEEQKEAIRKYFDLLYMGVKKEEGN